MREKHSKYQEHFHIISRVSRIDTVYCCGLISFLLFDLLILNLFIKGYELFLLTFVIILYFECKVMRDITNAMVLELYKKYLRKCFRKNMQGTTFAEGCSIYVQVVPQYWSVYICRSKYYICWIKLLVILCCRTRESTENGYASLFLDCLINVLEHPNGNNNSSVVSKYLNILEKGKVFHIFCSLLRAFTPPLLD